MYVHYPRCTKICSVRKFTNTRVRNFYAYRNFCDYSRSLLLEQSKDSERKHKSWSLHVQRLGRNISVMSCCCGGGCVVERSADLRLNDANPNLTACGDEMASPCHPALEKQISWKKWHCATASRDFVSFVWLTRPSLLLCLLCTAGGDSGKLSSELNYSGRVQRRQWLFLDGQQWVQRIVCPR